MPKKSLTLPYHILKVAEEEAAKNYNGSFSGLILDLIKRNKHEEIDRAYDEMPVKLSEAKKASIENKCLYCGEKIKPGSLICNAKFKDGHQQYVHKKCCRD